ncbi:MAG: gliding motility-associated C-terminal domain-containing protein [Saprospiraceae bacterium]|nr:gliding motility-associated C-terminal domain-containing protein [Saprospiraceae bacterium]
MDQCTKTFQRTCSPPPPPNKCLTLVKDSIDCIKKKYCFQVKNSTSPGFNISIIELWNISPSTVSITPNPIKIPQLSPGMTSNWICVEYDGVIAGDQLSYSIIGHQDYAVGGGGPILCCADTITNSIKIPDCGNGNTCCKDSLQFKNLLSQGWQVNVSGCDVSVSAPQFDTCHWFTSGNPGWDDGTPVTNVIISAASGEVFTHKYTQAGTYNICINVFESTDGVNVDPCWSGKLCTTVVIDNPCDSGTCCNITQSSLDGMLQDITLLASDVECELCLSITLDSCTFARIDFGNNKIQNFDPGVDSLYCLKFTSGSVGADSIKVKIIRKNIDGTICKEANKILKYNKKCPLVSACCNVTNTEIEMKYNQVLQDAVIIDCELCLQMPLDTCTIFYINWGDNIDTIGTGDGAKYCHKYSSTSKYIVSMEILRFNDIGDPCIETTITKEYDIKECKTECDMSSIEIFNAITPNGDQVNEFLKINKIPQVCGEADIEIYNRWGQKVWSEKAYKNTWNGESNQSKPLPDGTYYLIVSFPDTNDKDKEIKTFIDLRRDN